MDFLRSPVLENSVKVSNIQSYNQNRKLPDPRHGLNISSLRSLRWMGWGEQTGANISWSVDYQLISYKKAVRQVGGWASRDFQ